MKKFSTTMFVHVRNHELFRQQLRGGWLEIAQQAAASSSSFSFQPSETAMYSSSSSSSSSSFSFTEPALQMLDNVEMLNSAEYVAGRELIKNDNLDEAIDHFNSLLEKTYGFKYFIFIFLSALLSDNDVLPVTGPAFRPTESKDPLSEVTAPLYYQYGSALCIKAEESTSCLVAGTVMEMRVEVRSNRKWGMENLLILFFSIRTARSFVRCRCRRAINNFHGRR